MPTRKLLEGLMEGKEKDFNCKEIARAIGCSGNLLYGFFEGRCELSFQQWILIIRFLKPEKEDELVETLSEIMIRNDDKRNIRTLCEYASTHRKFSLLGNLINALQGSYIAVNRDFAQLYEISSRYQQRNTPNEDLLFDLEAIQTKTVEGQIFANVLKAHVLYALKEFKTLFRIGHSIYNQLSKVKNPYLQDSYMARISEVLAQGYLFLKNDVKKARYYANNVLNSKYLGEAFKVHTLHLLGTSYLFENHAESVKWFEQYRDKLEGFGRYDRADEVDDRDIYFADILWGKEGVTDADSPVRIEKAHYFAKQGNIEAVEAMCKGHEECAFAICYLGMAKNDPEILLKSMAKFIENGCKFFAEFPKRELANHPAFIVSANIISNIQIA
ncbi:AimR family lysis-lysogeny pheromone receptor [Bacillus sp. ISL-57]|uniref:AimR family lysis-lysogeny pheromone receptor n=1 Tax=Bacillus sp. ISL-57 TaxID=2819135 RepID=UPI001BEC9882|nr:AimR family lysis-lysogeny pheromone receptor [Bacillus sp. ISL-57]MBT2714717.1 AimR family lysis-lysogeny pheromone receptor [Bacillus sp. ISL-57]